MITYFEHFAWEGGWTVSGGDLRLPDIKEASERDLAMLPGGCGGCEAWLEGIGVEMCEGEISG